MFCSLCNRAARENGEEIFSCGNTKELFSLILVEEERVQDKSLWVEISKLLGIVFGFLTL